MGARLHPGDTDLEVFNVPMSCRATGPDEIIPEEDAGAEGDGDRHLRGFQRSVPGRAGECEGDGAIFRNAGTRLTAVHWSSGGEMTMKSCSGPWRQEGHWPPRQAVPESAGLGELGRVRGNRDREGPGTPGRENTDQGVPQKLSSDGAGGKGPSQTRALFGFLLVF